MTLTFRSFKSRNEVSSLLDLEKSLINQEVFEMFYKALKGKRLIVFSGLFKEAMTRSKNGELEEINGKLIDEKEVD